MKICFVIATLTSGGAERVVAALGNYFITLGHDVTIITFEKDGVDPHYYLDSKISLKQLNLLSLKHTSINYFFENLRRIIRIRKELIFIEPDVIISFMLTANILNIISRVFTGIPLIISERVHPGYHNFGKLREYLRKMTYRYADSVVVQTEDISKWFQENLHLQCRVIENPLEIKYFTRTNDGYLITNKKTIVAMGRLDRQKGHDLLIGAFSRIHDNHPDWRLYIYGEGPEYENLEKLIKQYDLRNKIFLKETVKDVRDAFDTTEIFVLPSRYEGYPNVLIEALSYNLCVIATDCPGANSIILENGRYGVLVENENEDAIAAALSELINSDTKRINYKKNARNAVLHLSIEKIANTWMSLIGECV